MSPHFYGAIHLKSIWSQGTDGSGSGDEAGGEEDYEEEEENDGGTEGSGEEQGALYKCLEITLFGFGIGI